MNEKEMLIQQTDSNSFVKLTPGEESLIIRGNSFTADPRSFYEDLLTWAKTFKTTGSKKLAIEITPGYYSTANIQVFNLLFKTLDMNNPGDVTILFYLEQEEEEDMNEVISSLTFNTGLKPLINYSKK